MATEAPVPPVMSEPGNALGLAPAEPAHECWCGHEGLAPGSPAACPLKALCITPALLAFAAGCIVRLGADCTAAACFPCCASLWAQYKVFQATNAAISFAEHVAMLDADGAKNVVKDQAANLVQDASCAVQCIMNYYWARKMNGLPYGQARSTILAPGGDISAGVAACMRWKRSTYAALALRLDKTFRDKFPLARPLAPPPPPPPAHGGGGRGGGGKTTVGSINALGKRRNAPPVGYMDIGGVCIYSCTAAFAQGRVPTLAPAPPAAPPPLSAWPPTAPPAPRAHSLQELGPPPQLDGVPQDVARMSVRLNTNFPSAHGRDPPPV
ncbi:hypothetical protein CYMTET_50929 [Cymbomonas tetramitiformis]|uniref:Uncharacterized protein n=1 Tax=Cymbomonas tetramitiformis TaxID=36881 RepID=A0AAE0BN88_9CHLO|nr:hypothetical protein CYMTET_50929 [Cymbomonas tetramitiformis]